MRPILLHFEIFAARIDIGSYKFFLLAAAIAGLVLAWRTGRRLGLPGKAMFILLATVGASVPVGARLLHLATNTGLYADRPVRLLSLDATGFALFGGLILAVVAGVVVCRILKLDLWKSADACAPALGVSLAVMRVGCFLDGCCPGTPSTLPWAVTLPDRTSDVVKAADSFPLLGGGLSGLVPAAVPTHPVALYELAAALVGAGLAFWLIKRRARAGTAFLAFTIVFTASRLAAFPLRVPNSSYNGPAWFYPALYLAIILLSIRGRWFPMFPNFSRKH